MKRKKLDEKFLFFKWAKRIFFVGHFYYDFKGSGDGLLLYKLFLFGLFCLVGMSHKKVFFILRPWTDVKLSSLGSKFFIFFWAEQRKSFHNRLVLLQASSVVGRLRTSHRVAPNQRQFSTISQAVTERRRSTRTTGPRSCTMWSWSQCWFTSCLKFSSDTPTSPYETETSSHRQCFNIPPWLIDINWIVKKRSENEFIETCLQSQKTSPKFRMCSKLLKEKNYLKFMF